MRVQINCLPSRLPILIIWFGSDSFDNTTGHAIRMDSHEFPWNSAPNYSNAIGHRIICNLFTVVMWSAEHFVIEFESNFQFRCKRIVNVVNWNSNHIPTHPIVEIVKSNKYFPQLFNAHMLVGRLRQSVCVVLHRLNWNYWIQFIIFCVHLCVCVHESDRNELHFSPFISRRSVCCSLLISVHSAAGAAVVGCWHWNTQSSRF